MNHSVFLVAPLMCRMASNTRVGTPVYYFYGKKIVLKITLDAFLVLVISLSSLFAIVAVVKNVCVCVCVCVNDTGIGGELWSKESYYHSGRKCRNFSRKKWAGGGNPCTWY